MYARQRGAGIFGSSDRPTKNECRNENEREMISHAYCVRMHSVEWIIMRWYEWLGYCVGGNFVAQGTKWRVSNVRLIFCNMFLCCGWIFIAWNVITIIMNIIIFIDMIGMITNTWISRGGTVVDPEQRSDAGN